MNHQATHHAKAPRRNCTITQVFFYRKRITTTRPPTKQTSNSLAKKLVGQGVQGLHFGSSGANDDASAGKVVGALQRLEACRENMKKMNMDEEWPRRC
jgi:hypothetical protein